jgi:hypothetical protein
MQVGDMIKMITEPRATKAKLPDQTGLLVHIGKRHNNRRVGTVLTDKGIETWPLDSYYEYEVINESR